ncbi:MAG: hypothetical protein ACM3PZ_00610 [Bacillota bacterium]
MKRIFCSIAIGIGIFLYIPFTMYVYLVVIGLVYDMNWFNLDYLSLMTSLTLIISWLILPIAVACYYLMPKKGTLRQ